MNRRQCQGKWIIVCRRDSIWNNIVSNGLHQKQFTSLRNAWGRNNVYCTCLTRMCFNRCLYVLHLWHVCWIMIPIKLGPLKLKSIQHTAHHEGIQWNNFNEKILTFWSCTSLPRRIVHLIWSRKNNSAPKKTFHLPYLQINLFVLIMSTRYEQLMRINHNLIVTGFQFCVSNLDKTFAYKITGKYKNQIRFIFRRLFDVWLFSVTSGNRISTECHRWMTKCQIYIEQKAEVVKICAANNGEISIQSHWNYSIDHKRYERMTQTASRYISNLFYFMWNEQI